ncbi:MAG: hypothetical protein WD716_14090 [Fimbriimonadaceae bacterium]
MSEPNGRGIRVFAAIVVALFLLRLALGTATFPVPVANALSLLNTVLFIGLPVYALLCAASHGWKLRPAILLLVVGAVLHASTAVMLGGPMANAGFLTVLLAAVGQTGIVLWTLALGVIIALKLPDKNLMIPIAIFLIGFDMFLVFNPAAPTARLMREAPRLAHSALATVPRARAEGAPRASVQDFAYIGPADLLFSAAFFALMFRFGMNARRTAMWLIPVLVLYLLVILLFGDRHIGPLSLAMLPAMVPIGLTVLLVNRKEFKLQGQEVAGVFLVAALSIALALYGVYRANLARRQAPLPEPSLQGGVQEAPILQGSPSQAP